MPKAATWYHAHMDVIGRSEGKSAVGCVSYVTGVPMKDEVTGRWCKRNHPGDVIAYGTTAPKEAPIFFTDLSQLARAWNEAEKADTRKNSQLARHWNIALSRELDPAEQAAAMQEIAQRITDRYRTIVTWSVHAPTDHGDGRNAHGHLAHATRAVGEDGFGEKIRDLVAYKTAKQELKWIRETIADVLNNHLERIGSEERVSHLSYEELGIDREPMKHRGNKANQLELDGEPTTVGDMNRAIQSRNAEREELNEETSRAAVEAEQVAAQIVSLQTGQVIQMADLTPNIAGLDVEAEGLQTMSDAVTGEEEARRKAIEAERQRQAEAARQHARGLAAEGTDPLFKQQSDRLVEQAVELGQERQRLVERQQRIDSYTTEQQRLADQARKRQAQEEAAEAKEGEIRDARSRYAQALGAHYDIRDPYGSLARSAMAEYGSFCRDREELARLIAQENDPARRKTLELRREIEAADYMAITSRRIAAQSEVIVGRSNTDEAVLQRARAAEFEARAKELRQQYRDQVVEQQLVSESEAPKPSEPAHIDPASRQRRSRSARGRSAEAGEKQAEAGDSDPGKATERRQRAQRGEPTQETDRHKPERGPDLER